MANKDRILLTPGNIQTPRSLWDETNRKSRLSLNQILTNRLVHPKEVERKQASRKERRTLSDIYYRKYKNIRDE